MRLDDIDHPRAVFRPTLDEPPAMSIAARYDQLAAAQSQNVIIEFWHLLRHNKKWWLSPILLLLLGALIVLGGTDAAPLIYTLF